MCWLPGACSAQLVFMTFNPPSHVVYLLSACIQVHVAHVMYLHSLCYFSGGKIEAEKSNRLLQVSKYCAASKVNIV